MESITATFSGSPTGSAEREKLRKRRINCCRAGFTRRCDIVRWVESALQPFSILHFFRCDFPGLHAGNRNVTWKICDLCYNSRRRVSR